MGFALAYIFVVFLIIPAIFVGLAVAGPAAIITVFVLCLASIIFVSGVNILQDKKPGLLPAKLQNWDFLPLWLRSLEPWDKLICTPLWIKLQKCRKTTNATGTTEQNSSKTALELTPTTTTGPTAE